ncbi:uncharacterized protein LOC116188699 [Punica granatum]|uniref:Uncharacterized protein LOC116188699 n=1 Tax=Punica granatum TaxID=22663 RepID=A0A6P8BUS8_PUNGR|nr:uncharacterized protein LOC116188699 [Punica granatum]
MVTALTAKNKVGMIDGTVPRPPENDPNGAKWDVCNALGNETRIYQLKAEIDNLKQEGMSVTKYYSRLKTLWDELDNYLEIPTCTCSATKLYTAQREREKTHQFLMDLGSESATVRSNILSHEPPHSLNKVYALILHEERKNIVTQFHENATPDGAVFFVDPYITCDVLS